MFFMMNEDLGSYTFFSLVLFQIIEIIIIHLVLVARDPNKQKIGLDSLQWQQHHHNLIHLILVARDPNKQKMINLWA